MRVFREVRGLSHQVVATEGHEKLLKASTACGQTYVLVPGRILDRGPGDVKCGHCRRSPRFVEAGGPAPPPYGRRAAT